MANDPDETATAASSGQSYAGHGVVATGAAAPLMLGRYVIVRELGAGGMGVVYAARDPELDREVAIKLLRARVRSAADEDQARARLVREGRAMAKLVHPNVIRVYDIGLHEGQVFVAMELIDGGTLAEWQAKGPRPWREVLAIYASAGRGLAAAHAAGIVHRDFKPANVLLARDGRVLVTDFGIARLEGGEGASSSDDAAALGHSGEVAVTQTGAILGTPEYMSPEQLRGAPVDARADQFAFCLALYRALYGEGPFVTPAGAAGEGSTPLEQLQKTVLAGQVRPPPRGSTVPGWVREHVLRGLRLDPAERFPSMDALLAALAADPAIRRRRVLGGVAAVALVGIAAWGLVRGGSGAEPCGGAAELLAGAWDGAARARVESTFLASGKPFARGSFDRVAARLDGYAGEWATQRTQACRATRVRHEQSEALLELRLRCLDERRAGLAALVAQLASADAALVEHALDVANRLDPLAACADTADLQAEAPAPTDPALAEKVNKLRARLDAIAAMNKAGKYQEALALARPLADEAEATGFAPLAGRARLELGTIEVSLNQMDAARQDLDRAVTLAGEGHTDRLLAVALAQLAGQETAARKDEEAAQSARLAEALATRQHDTEALGFARMTRATVLQRQGHVAEATELRKDVLVSYERDFGKSDARLLQVLNPLANGAMISGRLDEAQAWAQRALDLTVEVYGPDHPLVVVALNGLATLAERRGDDPAAIPLYERALGVAERAYGPEHPSVATLLHNLAIVHFRLDQYDEAAKLWQRALALTEKIYGPEHPEMCKVLAALAQLRSIQGRPQEALELTKHAIDIMTRADGPTAPGLSIFYANLALFQYEKGDLPGALATQQQSLDLTAKVEGKDSDAYGTGLSRMTRFLVADQRCADALPLTAEAIRLLEKHVGMDTLRLRRPLELRAKCLTQAGKPAEAFPFIERVAKMIEKAGGDESDQASVRLLRADALWALGKDRKRARAEAARAEEALAAVKDIEKDVDRKSLLADVRAWRRAHP
jgi:tetratricopeptide (TPR) repeat protein/predicted Ser/Thr protein kinase